jgi:prepilin-type N-terminal cleavage/methylation domain-containing protein
MKRELANHNCGFTLVELLMTIALLAFLGMMAGNTFDTKAWMADYRLKSAARDLFSNVQKTRMSAVNENRDWAIVFDTGNNQYHLCSNKGADNSWSALGDNTIVQTVNFSQYKSGIGFGAGSALKDATESASSFSSGFDFVSFNNNVLVFNSRGLASSMGYCYLSNDRGVAYAIGALISGAVRFKKWNGSSWE